MDVVTKEATASVAPVKDENPNGSFSVVLSTETLDRDKENLWADEWKTPLPARIHIDGDHGRSLEKTVGSAVPRIEGNQMVADGTFASTPYAQMVRQLVNEGHINSMSVTFAESKNQKGEGVQRELLNAAFVAIPANPEAVVLASKSAKLAEDKPLSLIELLQKDAGQDASGNNPKVTHDAMVQAVHDAACHLGAECTNMADADPGTADGANKSIDKVGIPLSELCEKLGLESSSTKDAGLPQESAEDSAVSAAAEKSAAAETADESADDSVKAKAVAKARALEFLIKQNTPQEG